MATSGLSNRPIDINMLVNRCNILCAERQIRNGKPSAYTFLSRVVPKTLLLSEAREVLSAYKDVPLLKAEIPQRQVAADVMGQGATLFDLKTRSAKEVANFYRQLFDEALNYGS